MTVSDIKKAVMHQTNNDVEDLGEFMPYLMEYINEGYDMLVNAFSGMHIYTEEYPELADDLDEPLLPKWAHRALADWATWLVYRNGNPSKQSRGYQYKTAFEEVRLSMTGGSKGKTTNFYNIPK